MKAKYYKILGVPNNSDLATVKKAYRKLVLKYHPDKNPSPDAHKKFLLVKQAYEIILNPNDFPTQGRPSSANTHRNNPKPSRAATGLSEEERKQRIKVAKHRYEQQQRYEQHEDEQFFKIISQGKLWKRFRVVMITCSILASIFVLDRFLPSRWESDSVKYGNRIMAYQGLTQRKVVPLVTQKNYKMWIEIGMYARMERAGQFQIEKTFWLNDIKKIWIHSDNGKFIGVETDFSITRSFPLIPIALLIPIITYFLRSKTTTYSVLFHVSLYMFGAFAFILLYSNDRWAHFISLGYI